MKTNFIYHVPTKLYFGSGQLTHLGNELKQHGKKVLLIYGSERLKKTELYSSIVEQAKKAGVRLFEAGGVEANPRHTTVNRMASVCKKEGIDILLAVGGRSVLDCAKFVSAAAFYEGDCWDFFHRKSQDGKISPTCHHSNAFRNRVGYGRFWHCFQCGKKRKNPSVPSFALSCGFLPRSRADIYGASFPNRLRRYQRLYALFGSVLHAPQPPCPHLRHGRFYEGDSSVHSYCHGAPGRLWRAQASYGQAHGP